MGFSTTVTHAILIVAAVTAASILTSTVLFKLGAVSSAISQSVGSQVEKMLTDVTILGVFYNSTGGYFVVYAKNTGKVAISQLDLASADVYLGTYGSALELYTYNSTAGAGYWNYSKTKPSPSWEVGETIVVAVYNRTSVEPPYHVRLCLPNSAVGEYVGG